LADGIREMQKTDVTSDVLRSRLSEVVSRRYKQLINWLRFTK
jgi:hypothetical protein